MLSVFFLFLEMVEETSLVGGCGFLSSLPRKVAFCAESLASCGFRLDTTRVLMLDCFDFGMREFLKDKVGEKDKKKRVKK
jgi:hypothetical protein